jgi:cathepsin A (carboxypeptidase C)
MQVKLTRPPQVTAPCDIEDLCYPEGDLIEKYLNLDSTYAALQVPKAVGNYSIISRRVSEAFEQTKDLGINMLPELQYLLASQIDVLVYQGNLDLACNTAGAKRWTSNMAWKGQMEFTAKELLPWKSVEDGKEVVAGKFKEVNVKMVKGSDKTTRFTLLTVAGAGHMVSNFLPLGRTSLISNRSRWTSRR